MATRHLLLVTAAVLLCSSRLCAADTPEALQNKKYNEAYQKAMEYVHAHLNDSKAPRPIGSMLGGYVFGGFALMMTEDQPSADLKKCVHWCCHAIKDTGFNRNWYLSMCMYFLAEYSLKYGATDEIRVALKEGIEQAKEQQEATGGWCHHLKMWQEGDYNKKGGGQDIAIITTLIYGAFMEMKTFGMDPGSMFDDVTKNLQSLSDGYGFNYGTDNKVHDSCMGRGAYVLLGAYAIGEKNNAFVPHIIKGLEKRYKDADEGHAYPPLHYFGIAASMHRVGPEMYKKFTDNYLDKLLAKQDADGSVVLSGKQTKSDGLYDAPADTAVLACIILMMKPGIFSPYDHNATVAAAEKAAAAKAEQARNDAKMIAALNAHKEAAAAAEVKEGTLVPWSEKLHARIISGVKAGQKPLVDLHISKNSTQKVKIVGADEKELAVQFDNGGQISLLWEKLDRRKDMLSLARAFAKADNAADHVLIAIYQIANSDAQNAEMTFSKVLELDTAQGKKLIEDARKSLN